jgi:hypothetical protein
MYEHTPHMYVQLYEPVCVACLTGGVLHACQTPNACGGKIRTQNFTLAGNTIVQNGCLQGKPPYYAGYGPNASISPPSSDVGAVSMDLPGGSGQIQGNLIVRCQDDTVPLWGGPPAHHANYTFSNQLLEAAELPGNICALPEVLWDSRQHNWPNLVASCETEGATLRYTLDGSRPSEDSPLWPPSAAVVGAYHVCT